ncbi:MAG: N-6 DNA methylase, partial [Planctomycetaceae bacterium]|nr:N-6 DNA methylase [Planctomycetaceae bacterium]
ILSQYKYKLSVDDLVDSEYAQTVDPEFIGKVFESLLACIDADSKENRRKTTGSFYTPREIVDYMVNEALDSYLKNYSQKNSQKNSQNDSQDNLHNDSKKDLQNDSPNDSALLQCKILDPACGSGAFPCGVMNEIMRRIDPDKKLTQQERYHKKLEILQKVIYCVDIQSMAVQISSLRFFLALIQEIIPDKKKDNYGIEPLPNLETKFICANALIGLTKENGKLQLQNIKKTIELLQRTRERHIIAANMQEKKELQNYDKDLRKLLSAAMEDAGELSHETAELLLKWNPYDQTKSTPFFDPQWMFGIENGFDIVISNPPYVNVEKIDKTIKNNISQFRTAYQKYDLYILFYEKAIDLLKPNGQLSYITSNKFLSQGYGLLLRKEFLKYYIHTIINFNYDIFENATVRTCILNLQKTNRTNENIKIIDIQTEKDKYKFSQLKYNFINQNIFNETIENNFRINLTNKKIEIINKIRQNTFRIDDIFSVNYGLRPSSEKLGLKKAAFIFETNETGQYKKYFEGKDMGKWKIKSTSYINYQPDVMYNSMFVELFENKKLVGLRTLSDIEKLRFIYDEDNLYCNDSVVILVLWYLFNNVKYQTISRNITKEKIECSKKFDYFFVQGILNSRLIKFYVNELLYDGTHFYPNHIKSLPIKNITIKQQRPIITLVNKIHSEKSKNPNADTTKLESKIDRLVYELYDLTEDEIKIIEG